MKPIQSLVYFQNQVMILNQVYSVNLQNLRIKMVIQNLAFLVNQLTANQKRKINLKSLYLVKQVELAFSTNLVKDLVYLTNQLNLRMNLKMIRKMKRSQNLYFQESHYSIRIRRNLKKVIQKKQVSQSLKKVKVQRRTYFQIRISRVTHL